MNESGSGNHNEADQDGFPTGDQRTQMRWLVDKIDLLSKSIGLELESPRPVEVEGLYWHYLEVMAKNVGRGAIAIMPQVGADGHYALGSLVTAAAESNACFIVWVSPELNDAHLKALEWLYQATNGKIRGYGIQICSGFRVLTSMSESREQPVT
jgi:hypothetical protein